MSRISRNADVPQRLEEFVSIQMGEIGRHPETGDACSAAFHGRNVVIHSQCGRGMEGAPGGGGVTRIISAG